MHGSPSHVCIASCKHVAVSPRDGHFTNTNNTSSVRARITSKSMYSLIQPLIQLLMLPLSSHCLPGISVYVCMCVCVYVCMYACMSSCNFMMREILMWGFPIAQLVWDLEEACMHSRGLLAAIAPRLGMRKRRCERLLHAVFTNIHGANLRS